MPLPMACFRGLEAFYRQCVCIYMYETRLPGQASAEETGSLQWEGGVGDRHSFLC
jgi:hypothetical protein